MAITKILNIMESEGRNPASHLKNALEYIQNPDKTEECVLVGGINCLPDTAFEQMEETKNIFHKTGKRQGYHVIISFSPEEKVTAEQAMYEEKELLSVMEYYVCVVNKEKPNQIVNSYLELWEEILNQGIHIELSRSSMYILRRCITGFSFEQGIRMRKIIEKISLQR